MSLAIGVDDLIKEYLTLKKHEYESVLAKVKANGASFNSKIEKNNYGVFEDTHVILSYNYTDYPIREDKFFHTLNGNLIDLSYFVKDSDALKDYLAKELKGVLKEYKITYDMLNLALSLNNDNFYVEEDGLLFIFSLSQFGINKVDEIKILVNYKDLYEYC